MKSKSFTLIELLVVIVIIGILAGVIIVSTSSSISKANFAKAQSFSNTVQNELLLNLVSEWTFDDLNNTGEDTWGNNNGTVSGAAYQNKSTGNCVYGGCYSFDGNDYIEIPNNTNLYFSTSLTINFWIKTNNSLATVGIISKPNVDTGGGSPKYIMDISAEGKLRFFGYVEGVPRGITSATGSSFNNNSWHHVLGTFDGTYWKIFIDGSLDNVALGSYTLESSIYPLYIGARNNNSNYFNGFIDDVRIYNASLTTAQIKQEYIAGLNSLLANGNLSKEEYDQRLNNLASK